MDLFVNNSCSACHGGALLSDQAFHNIGVRPQTDDAGHGAVSGVQFENGTFKTPTLRNVDKRPRADFVKAYMHNGYLKSLKEVVHFYNTRDALPACNPGDRGEKITCWPAPENSGTMNRKQLGDLKLSDKQEDLLVTFLKTLTDGYSLRGDR